MSRNHLDGSTLVEFSEAMRQGRTLADLAGATAVCSCTPVAIA